MNDIPLTGWVAMGIIAVLLLVTNLSLLSLLRKKNNSDQSSTSILSDTMKALKNPWEKEDQPLKELSEQVARLKDFNQEKDTTNQ